MKKVAIINFELIKKNIYNNLNEGHEKVSNFKNKLKLIKENDLLKNEYYLFKNIKEYKFINESLTIDFLKLNLSYFDDYTIDDLNDVHNSLVEGVKFYTKIIDQIDVNIHNLLEYHLTGDFIKPTNIKKYNNLINEVVGYIKNIEHIDKDKMDNIIAEDFTLKQIVPIISKSFNEKYSVFLNEEEINYLIDLSSFNESKEESVLKLFKNRAIETLTNDNELDKIMVNECVNKIKSISYNSETFYSDLISIYDLIN